MKTTRSAPGEPARKQSALVSGSNTSSGNEILTPSVTTPSKRELLPRAGNTEVKSFEVVVLVRVVVAADLVARLEEVAALVDGGGNLGGGVALRGCEWP